MAKLNIERTRKALQAFEFKTLFTEELGWSNVRSSKSIYETIKEISTIRKPIAELSGAIVFEISTPEGIIPDAKQRFTIAKEVQKQHFEHVLIFIDKDRKQSIWHWLKNQDKHIIPREHFFFKHQPGDSFIVKIASLVVDISEFDKEGNIAIAEVANRIKNALDIEVVVKKFFRDYQQEYIDFVELISGIDSNTDRRWYASVILNRLMFIYFLQKKMFLDNGDENYLNNKLIYSKEKLGNDKFYEGFLGKLFFEGFAKKEAQRSKGTNELIGEVKYLNGGLFLYHKIEIKYNGKIKIPDSAFENLFELFNRYSWTLNDTPGGADNEMNPDVLGYIFEKYINQKAFGAYYTRTEITDYLCEQTVYKLILDEVNGTGKKQARKRYDSMAELLLHLDADTCRQLIVGEQAVLSNLSLLDPACGSGAFLVAAMKTLINVYAAILGKIEFFADKELNDWKDTIKRNHPSINYYIKKQIITNNLYGVDLMEEATEIAKLRLFLALVASAETADQLEPLPNIDFNIMNGNSLIGLMRVDESEYNKHQTGDLFKTSYHELVQKREAAIRAFKSFENTDENNQIKKETIDRMEEEAYETLNLMLGQEFNNLNIKYEQVTWNDKTSEEGKTIKRSINIKDVIALEPFHWGYKFSEIFRKKNGFDAIITNPPWETFQPNAREFAMEHSTNVFLKKMDNKDFISELQVLMKNDKIREEYLKYNSYYNHTRQYYRVANQYLNQVPIINGKRHGKDINLYKLFLEQSYNLIKQNGYCGIVIPSGIYTDLGSKKLREMLFEKTKITGLFSFENKKEIFEGVHRSFKFVVLSFEKGGKTMEFPSAFMRHDVEELENFPQFGASNISVEFVRKQSPESLSISELKSAMDFVIADKIIQFPFLSDKIKGKWNIEYQREFNMTDDAYLFVKQKSKNSLPLFEGKMIWQYTHRYAEPKFWIDAKEGRNALLGRLTDTKQILSYQKYRLTYRDISSPTNERTMINTILPPNVFTGNTLYVSKNDIAYSDMLIIVAFLNSFINDYVIRQKITSHCNMFYVYQLSVPRLSKQDKWYQAIAERAAKLICVVSEFSDLWTDVMKTKWSEKDTLINDFDRNVIRAELDGIIAHNYSLTEEEFNYVLNTFPIVSQPQKVAALNAYRDVERGLIKPV